jgi:hemerythrin-like metal-binding protein
MTATANPFLVWKDSWLVGIRVVDSQHKNLVSILNQLHEAMRTGQGKTVLGEILGRLINYTKAHFAAEEGLLEMHGYPQLGPHRLEHEKLTAKVIDFQKQYAAGAVTLSVEVMQFLSDWLQHHILGTDMKYSTFLKAKGVQ